jgi:hypothetical protein
MASAAQALTVAIGLTADEAMKGYLVGRLAALQHDPRTQT